MALYYILGFLFVNTINVNVFDDHEAFTFVSPKDLKSSISLKQVITFNVETFHYTGCRKINVFQVGGLAGKNLRNLEKIK
jgi:hypothetical protein